MTGKVMGSLKSNGFIINVFSNFFRNMPHRFYNFVFAKLTHAHGGTRGKVMG